MLRKIKCKLFKYEQKVLYPSGLSPEKLYGIAKIQNLHKMVT